MPEQSRTKIHQNDYVFKGVDIIAKVNLFSELDTIIYTDEYLQGFVYLGLIDSKKNGFGAICMSIEDFEDFKKNLEKKVRFIKK